MSVVAQHCTSGLRAMAEPSCRCILSASSSLSLLSYLTSCCMHRRCAL